MRQVLQTVLAEVDLLASDAASERVARRAITLTPARQATAVVKARRASAPGIAAAEPPLAAATG